MKVYLYSAFFVVHARRSRMGSHSFTCNYTDACVYLVIVHQMAPPHLGGGHLIAAYYSFIYPERMKG